jgi:hypothetical protein
MEAIFIVILWFTVHLMTRRGLLMEKSLPVNLVNSECVSFPGSSVLMDYFSGRDVISNGPSCFFHAKTRFILRF